MRSPQHEYYNIPTRGCRHRLASHPKPVLSSAELEECLVYPRLPRCPCVSSASLPCRQSSSPPEQGGSIKKTPSLRGSALKHQAAVFEIPPSPAKPTTQMMQFAKKWAYVKQKLGWGKRRSPATRNQHHASGNTDEASFANLSEVAAPPPVQNGDENAHAYAHRTMEESPN